MRNNIKGRFLPYFYIQKEFKVSIRKNVYNLLNRVKFIKKKDERRNEYGRKKIQTKEK